MTVRPIIKFPDPRLRVVATPVTVFDEALRQLATDLLDSLRAAPGIGITAPHIGIAQRIVVLELPEEDGARTYINPAIVWTSDARLVAEEGSISMPGVSDEIERASQVRVRYQDLDGAEQIEEASGLRAVCHQHEIDQLDGVFWTQRLSPVKRDRLTRRYQKLRRLA
jgi:peptide deformylase